MENYKFSIPIRINYITDESTLSIECLDDLEYVQDKYSVDLDFILDEYDYKVEMEEETMEEDEDYYGIEEDEIFSNVIKENWKRIIKKLNKTIKLDELEDSDVELFFNITKENFEKHIKNNSDFNIKSISLIDFNKTKSEFYINIEIDNKLSKDEIESLKNWVETQTSENWGEDFSKIDLSEKFDNDDMYIYLIPWATNKDVKYIK